MTTLRAVGMGKSFGGLRALADVSLDVPPGRVTSLIGPNGAGKTTFFNCLTGLLDPDEGEVWFGDTDLSKLETHQRSRAGIGRTFQRLEVFTGLTVFENLQVAAEAGSPVSAMLDAVRLRHPDDHAVTARVRDVLERLGIAGAADTMAGDLPTGVLRLVELGRALCARPRVLLLDELASGLDEQETEHLASVLQSLAADGLGVLLIEHDIELVLSISEEIYVLDFGKVIAQGGPEAIAADPEVRRAYIGTEAAVGNGAPGRTARGRGKPAGRRPAADRSPGRRSDRSRERGGRRGAAPRR